MKIMLTSSFLFLCFISYSQEYGTGRELVKLQGASIEFYDNKTLDNLLPEKITTVEDVIQYKCFQKDSQLLKNIYTDITPGLLNSIKYYIENPEKDPGRLATFVKLEFKFEVVQNGQRLTLIQYTYFKDEEHIKTTASLLVKDSEQWKICGYGFLESLPGKPLVSTHVFTRLKPTKLYFLLTGEKSGESLLDEVVRKTRHKNGFDVDKFHLLIKKWRKEKDRKNLDYFFFPFK